MCVCLEHNEAVHQLFIDFKKAYDSIRREALYNILIEFGIPKKLVRLIKMCLTETYNRVRVGKNLSEMFPIRNGLKQVFKIKCLYIKMLEMVLSELHVLPRSYVFKCSDVCLFFFIYIYIYRHTHFCIIYTPWSRVLLEKLTSKLCS